MYAHLYICTEDPENAQHFMFTCSGLTHRDVHVHVGGYGIYHTEGP